MDKKQIKYYLPIIIFMLIQNFISNELFFIIGLIYVCYNIFLNNKMKIFKPFKEYSILIIFLIWGFILGLINIVLGDTNKNDFFRDIFYFVNPLVYIYIGAMYAKNNVDIYKIFNSFIISGTILSLLSFVNILLNISSLNMAFTVQAWRDISGDGIMVASIAMAIIFSKTIPKEERMSKKVIIVATIIMLLQFLITLSRTNIMILIIMYTIFILNDKDYKKVLKNILITTSFIGILLFSFYKILPSSISQNFLNKILDSSKEISAKHKWDTLAEIQGNWRGYETYCAKEEWKKSDGINQIIGNGFGKRIYVGTYAFDLLKQVDYSGNKADSIPVLHNGYFTMLIKLGVLGMMLYVIFYLLIINKAVKNIKKYPNNIYGKTLLSIGIILLIMTYFLNGLYKDYCFYPIIILLGYTAFYVQYFEQKEKK